MGLVGNLIAAADLAVLCAVISEQCNIRALFGLLSGTGCRGFQKILVTGYLGNKFA